LVASFNRPGGNITGIANIGNLFAAKRRKARSWVNELASGRVKSFAEIAERERKVERHIHPAHVHTTANDGGDRRRSWIKRSHCYLACRSDPMGVEWRQSAALKRG
jgi:hypothetical protein